MIPLLTNTLVWQQCKSLDAHSSLLLDLVRVQTFPPPDMASNLAFNTACTITCYLKMRDFMAFFVHALHNDSVSFLVQL